MLYHPTSLWLQLVRRQKAVEYMTRAVIERKDPIQRRNGSCRYELWVLSMQGRRIALVGSVSVQFRAGNPDWFEADEAKSALRAAARSKDLEVVREDA